MDSKRRRILVVMAAALLLRVLVPIASFIAVGDEGVFLFPDSSSYFKPAEGMLRSGRFAAGDQPEISRTPGYPILLLPGVVLGKPVLVTVALQVVLSLLTVWLVYRTSALVFENEDAAAAAALLCALEPLSVLYTSLMLTETLFTSLLVVAFYFLVDYLKRGRSLPALLLAAVALAGSVYVRPVSYYLPLLVSLVLLPALVIRYKSAKYAAHVVAFLIVSAGLVSLWQVRNRVEAGYNGFSAISDINLYICQAASVRAKTEGIPYLEVREQMRSELFSMSDPRKYELMRQEGVRMVRAHPGIYAAIHLRGMLRMLFDPGSMDYLKVFGAIPESSGTLGDIVDRGLIPVVLRLLRDNSLVFWTQFTFFGLLVAYYVFAFIGLLSGRCSTVLARLAILAVVVYFVVISGGPQAHSRFRHPVMPFVCVLAGCGLRAVTATRWGRRASESRGEALAPGPDHS